MAEPEPVPLTSLINFVHPFAVTVTSTHGGHHVPTSYHWRHRAIDVAGPPAELRAIMRRVMQNPGAFREAFYDPFGRYVKNGAIRNGRIGGHMDHVHLAK